MRTLTMQERVEWLEINKPDTYTSLLNWRVVEDGDIDEWLDHAGVPREIEI